MKRASSPNSLPVAVTMGCPAGVGPEVCLKAVTGACADVSCVIVGDLVLLERAAGIVGIRARLQPWQPGREALPYKESGAVFVMPVTALDPGEVPFGRVSEVTGMASYEYVQKALDLVLSGGAAALATAPISKEGLRLAGIDFPGHTEMLASRCGIDRFVMMMAGSRLRVTLVTIHIPLKEVPERISIQKVTDTIAITWQALRQDFAITAPRLAVAGLNPHAGEVGMFGSEEQKIIAPAVSMARDAGMDASGPFPPDTVFWHAAKGGFDAVVAMYHDQGLIPFKLLHFSDGVNVTLGLPIVRTSVDHGTAYDIAGTGRADADSMASAVRMARMIWKNRQAS